MTAEQQQAASVTAQDLVILARLNGLALTAGEAEALLPAYRDMQGWLAALREALEEGGAEEPATAFNAGEGASRAG